MKKLMKFFGIVAVAAMSLTACQNDINEQVNANGEKVTVEITANAPATRSAFGEKVDGVYPSTWSGNETVYFAPYQPTDATLTMSTVEVATAGESAKFDVTFDSTAENGSLYAFSPKGAQNGAGGFTSNKLYVNATPYIWTNVVAEQTTTATSCDDQVHILFGAKEYSGGFPTSANMELTHVLAYGKMTIKNFEGEIASVKVTFPVAVAGSSVKYYYTSNTFDGASATEITITNDVEGNNVMWFGVVPTNAISEEMIVVVTDGENKTYTKEFNPNGALSFVQGRVSNFAIDMAGIEADVVETYDWVVVDPANALEAGDYVLVGLVSGTPYSLVANGGSAAPTLGNVTLTDGNAKIDAATITDAMIFTLGGTADNYTFMNGSAYLYVNGANNNGLRVGSSANTTWTITTSTANANAFFLKHNSTSRYVGIYNNQDWRSYTSATHANYQTNGVYLYKKTTAVVDTNIAQVLTYTPAEQTVVIGYESEFVPPVLEGAKTAVTYSSSNAEVATVDANSGAVTLVGGKGTATITATAERDETYKAAVATATITVEAVTLTDPADLEWDADDLTAQIITLSGEHLDKEGLTVEVSEPTNFTVTTDGFTLSIVPNAENETEEAIENTITISIMKGETALASRQVNLTQKGIVVASGKSYVKVTDGTIESGATYLIVAGNGSKVMIPTTGSGKKNSQDVTIIDNTTIASTSEIDAYAVTITANGDNYDVTFVSAETTYYLYYNSSTNLTTGTTSSKPWTISTTTTKGSFAFVCSTTTTRGLMFRAGSYNQFGGYATSNLSSSDEYFNVDLYKLVE